MEKRLDEALEGGAAQVGLTLDAEVRGRLLAYLEELLKWNRRVNLTAVREPLEAVEKHLVDSLAVVPELQGATRLLDLGSGAGLPGIPLAVVMPTLEVLLADAVEKKVAFMRVGLVRAGLAGRVKAVHLRAGGDAAGEGVGCFDAVVSRALMDVEPFLRLAVGYLGEGGRVVAMMGRSHEREALEGWGASVGLRLESERRYALPFSGDPRAVAMFRR